MKILRLLVLGALCLTGMSAQADIVNGVRQRTNVAQTEAFVADQVYYLFNTDTRLFFLGANNYDTRASVGDKGYKVKFVTTDAENGIYELTDSVETKSAWMATFSTPDGAAIWVDNSSETYRYWKVNPTEGNIFRISNYGLDTLATSPTNGKFLGAHKTGDTRLYFFAPDENQAIDWVLVSEENYKAWLAAWTEYKPLYDKAAELKASIDEAVAKGIDVNAQQTVYLNEAATLEELEAAIAAVKEALKEYAVANATPDNPSDISSLITNATHDSNTGWSGTSPSFNSGAAEHYNKNYDTYQVVKGMPQGVYMLSLQGFYRAGTTADEFTNRDKPELRHGKMYVIAGNDTLTQALTSNYNYNHDPLGVDDEAFYTDAATGVVYTVPNTMASAAEYFKKGDYVNTLVFAVPADSAKIGLKKTTTIGSDWTIWNDWSLSYYGNQPASFQFYLDEFKKSLKSYELGEDVIYTKSYLEAYNSAIETATASDYKGTMAAINAIKEAAAALDKNLALWVELQEVIEEATSVAADPTLDTNYTGELVDWVMDAEDILTAAALTNEELEALIAEKKAEIEEAKKHPTGERDCTDMLTNADFEQGTKGWTGFNSVHKVKWGDSSKLEMPTTGGTSTNTCAEAFSAEQFDLYQVVENAPVGVYEISVQGFCRNGRGDVAWSNYSNQTTYSQPGKFPVWVYLNAKQTPFVNVFTEPVETGHYKAVDANAEVYVNGENEYPNGMISSAIAFSEGMYVQKAYGLVAKPGDAMRIGVKGKSCGLDGEDDNWVIFDNFKLTWKGYDAAVIKPVLEEELEKAEANAATAMGKNAYEALAAAIAAGKSALEGTDGETMFNALSGLFDVDSLVNASIANFAELQTKINALSAEIGASQASDDVKTQAALLVEDIQGKLTSHAIDDADVDTYVQQINEMITKLRVPSGEASDLAPLNVTSVITNPNYDSDATGWSGTQAARSTDYANCEIFNVTPFDYYQDIVGLPKGTYRVALNAFYRAGSSVQDYEKLDSTDYNAAQLYAISSEGTSSKQLTRLASHVTKDANTIENYAVVKTDTIDAENQKYTYYMVANTMGTAGDAFLNGLYGGNVTTGEGNVVTVKVGDDGKLRIGLMKKYGFNQDWTIFDNWQLWYFGENSALTPDEDKTAITDITNSNPVSVEFYTIDGRKATAAQKGIIIQKMVMPNGTVVVRKVRK